MRGDGSTTAAWDEMKEVVTGEVFPRFSCCFFAAWYVFSMVRKCVCFSFKPS